MLRLLDVVLDSKYSFKDKVAFLKTCSNSGFFRDDDAESIDFVAKKIKALLSTTSEKAEGLLMLQIFLDECSTEAFVQNAVSWAHLTLKVIKGVDNVEDKRLACQVFQQLIPALPSFPSLSKQVSNSIVGSLFEAIMRVSPEDEWVEDAFKLLLCCMKTFPGAFGSHKITIENFIIKHLDEWTEPTLKILATCLSLLPWCSGGGIQGTNHSSAWGTQLSNMLHSLEKIIDYLYNGADIDEDGSPLLLSSLELPPIPSSDPFLSAYCLQKHFQFLGQCLLQMLSGQHSTIVKMPYDDLLSFIWKALSVNSLEMLEKPSIEAMAIASVIPTIHCVTLSILESLICGFSRQLVVHAHTINHILLRSLDWTAKNNLSYGMEKSYSRVRVQTYQVLQVWMESLGPMSVVYEKGEAFIDHFLNDLRVEQDHIQLLSPTGQDRPRGRKRKRKQAEMIANSASAQKKVNLLANKELCLEALIGLRIVLYSCGCLLDLDLHKKIHNVIVQTLVEIQQQIQCGDSAALLIPYSSMRCRRELYAVLLACVLSPHPQWPPPLQPCVAFFKQGCIDPSIQVSSFCSEGMAVLNMVMHPRVTVVQYLEQQVETSMLDSISGRASNIMVETPVPRTQHIRHESNEDDMDYSCSYSQENLPSQSSIKKDMWRGKERNVNVEKPRPAAMESAEKVPSINMPVSHHQSLVTKQKSSTTAVVTQQIKTHSQQAPQASVTPTIVESQQKLHHGKGNIIQRATSSVQRATEEVVVLSEEESAEENHMEEGMDEEDEDEEEDEEEEGEEEYYPEEDEDGEFESHMKEDAYYRDKSPSSILAGSRSAENSSSTNVAVTSIVGNLVSETVSNNNRIRGILPLQKARRTGVLARTEHSHDTEEGEISCRLDDDDDDDDDDDEEDLPPVQKARRTGVLARNEHSHDLEDPEVETCPVEDEGAYEGEEICEDEEEEDEEEEIEEEVEEGLVGDGEEREGDERLQEECDDDVEEIQTIEEQGLVDGSQYEEMHKWNNDQDPAVESNDVMEMEEALIPTRIDDSPLEEQQITVLQPLQAEHSLLSDQYEEPVITTTLEPAPDVNEADKDMLEIGADDSEPVSQSHEQSENDSDVIELSDSPQKVCPSVMNREEDTKELEPSVQNNEITEVSVVVQASDVEDDDDDKPVVVKDKSVVDSQTPVTDASKSLASSPNRTLSNETHSDANDVPMVVEEIHCLLSNEHLNQVTENSVHDTNHSSGETSNCAPDAYGETEAAETFSGNSNESRTQSKNVNRSMPDSPEEPTAKKICYRLRENEDKESEQEEEESPPVDVMLQSFVCLERETE